MKLAIIGSRLFNNYLKLEREVLSNYELKDIESIVSGGAKGADSLGAEFAKRHQLQLIEFIPEWKKYGRKAGYLRNTLIVDEADCIIAFLEGESRGTWDSIQKALKLNKPVIIIPHEQ